MTCKRLRQCLNAERIVDGATFILSAPEMVPAVWGRGDQVLWPEDESLMIAGTLGLGKTTLAGPLVRAVRFGGEVLGFPVVPVGEPILYLALDPPRQIARSMRRQFGERHQRWLSEPLKVHGLSGLAHDHPGIHQPDQRNQWGAPPPGKSSPARLPCARSA